MAQIKLPNLHPAPSASSHSQRRLSTFLIPSLPQFIPEKNQTIHNKNFFPVQHLSLPLKSQAVGLCPFLQTWCTPNQHTSSFRATTALNCAINTLHAGAAVSGSVQYPSGYTPQATSKTVATSTAATGQDRLLIYFPYSHPPGVSSMGLQVRQKVHGIISTCSSGRFSYCPLLFIYRGDPPDL